ncbi:hypothetical protein [Thermodesulforhabdus norvegica]|uniref:Uncharacterized protein n=1 Tax=Thermodesulforhabdus norvegica TaxID=39841 RepID=A0A1I4STH8_9BACT|nr:hypothetical protein [Thermodesulforhabdus norvegica]SFM67721.1 hypothetical protein SAMN05660836_01154 [Thermodesulforhabdus norvegica]
MRRYRAVWALVLVLGLSLADVSSGELQKFYAQGVAPYAEGDAGVRDRAVSDFKQQVLLQAIMEIIGPESVKENETLINESILSSPDRFINAYRIISETVTGGLFRISGEAEISRQLLEDELKALGIAGPSTAGTSESEYEAIPARTILWEDRSSCENYGNEFAMMLMDFLAQKGWSINQASETTATAKSHFRWVINSELTCPENLDGSYIVGTVEIRDGATGSIEAVISERVQKEAESPILEGLISLAEIMKPQLVRILENGKATTHAESLPKREEMPLTNSTWEITVPDHPCLVRWGQLEKALIDINLTFRVSKMTIGAGGCRVFVEGLPSSFPEYLYELEEKKTVALKIDYLDPSARTLRIRIFDTFQTGSASRNQ